MRTLFVKQTLAAAITAAVAVLSGCDGDSDNAQPATLAQGEAVAAPERLMLQQLGHNSVIVKWRGAGDRVCVGETQAQLAASQPVCVAAVDTELMHKEARILGLKPDTAYYYTLGEPTLATFNEEQRFTTAPEGNQLPEDGQIRLWLLGDSGTSSAYEDGQPANPGEQAAVKQGFHAFNQGELAHPVDMMLLLGDNAYAAGTDSEWQQAFFDFYPNMINKVPTLTTLGNHEMGVAEFDVSFLLGLPAGTYVMDLPGSSQSSDPDSYDDGNPDTADVGLPYLKIFSQPMAGEMGGVASGTELYYAYNYGTVHIVSLDSQLATKDDAKREAMKTWLQADLAANDRDWTLVTFHHPPYSKGENHDSDYEDREIIMREEFTPIFQQYGVDVVYTGHAHNYERSYQLKGHTGNSASFDLSSHAAMKDGEALSGNCGQEFTQTNASGENEYTVFAVNGASGKVSDARYERVCDLSTPPKVEETYSCLMPDWLQHPAHWIRYAELGSVVLDITEDTLIHRFVNREGKVYDKFVITRNGADVPASVENDFNCAALPDSANPEAVHLAEEG